MIGLQKSGVWVVLLGLLVLSLVASPVAAAKLATPVLVSPANNQHFYHGGFITLTWKPVAGADGYACSMQYKNGSVWTSSGSTTTTYPRFSFSTTVVPGNSYRWNVTAYDSTHAKDPSAPSPWRTFDFTTINYKLATPMQLSPASGTIFYDIGPPRTITCAWKPVLGADMYRLVIQWHNTGTGTWQDAFNGTLPEPTNTGFQFLTFPSAGQGRWRVSAHSIHWHDSDPSPWRTFTFV